jgi:hypothetical protein
MQAAFPAVTRLQVVHDNSIGPVVRSLSAVTETRGGRRLMTVIVLILKFLEPDQVIREHCSITLRKTLVV